MTIKRFTDGDVRLICFDRFAVWTNDDDDDGRRLLACLVGQRWRVKKVLKCSLQLSMHVDVQLAGHNTTGAGYWSCVTFADQLRWVLQCAFSVQIFLLYTVCHHCNSVATNLASRRMGRTNANGGVGGVWPAHSAHVGDNCCSRTWVVPDLRCYAYCVCTHITSLRKHALIAQSVSQSHQSVHVSIECLCRFLTECAFVCPAVLECNKAQLARFRNLQSRDLSIEAKVDTTKNINNPLLRKVCVFREIRSNNLVCYEGGSYSTENPITTARNRSIYNSLVECTF